MKLRTLTTGLLLLCGSGAFAQGDAWRDPQVNAINRLPMRASFFAYENGEMGHYKKFFKKLWTQPLYPIINLICALPMGILMVAYEVKHHGVEI